MEILYIQVDEIRPHPHNIRREIGDISELTKSVQAQGLLQPLVVVPQAGQYVLIAGHRRLAAAKAAGLGRVATIVRTDLQSNAQQIQSMLVENLQRTNLSVIEEADAYAQLELLGVTDAKISQATGRTPKTVRERKLIASLPAGRRSEIQENRLTIEGAIRIARLRERFAGDDEIVNEIDGLGTCAFSSNQIPHRIQRILDERERATEGAERGDVSNGEDSDEESTIAPYYQIEVEDAIREIRLQVWRDQAQRFKDWIQSTDTGELSLAAIAAILQQDEELDFFDAEAAGIETSEYGVPLNPVTPEAAIRYLVVRAIEFNVGDPMNWQLRTDDHVAYRARDLKALGLPLTDGDEALCGLAEQ